MLLFVSFAAASYREILSSCNAEVKSVECLLHALMCSVSVVTVVFIHTMEDDQRLNTLVHEGDTPHLSLQLITRV